MNPGTSVTEGYVPYHGYRTWYRIVGGQEEPGKLPLICLHGGPGATHDYFEPLEAVAGTGRRVVLYDQLGWGNSDHPSNPSLWTVGLFVEELSAIRRALGLERVHILGHSWGGMLALEYGLTQPKGLASLILANTTASLPQWMAETQRLGSELPPEVQQTIREHEAKGTTNAPEYQEACRAFAEHWIGVQREEFKRLGVEGDWEHYYSTMAYRAEAIIASYRSFSSSSGWPARRL